MKTNKTVDFSIETVIYSILKEPNLDPIEAFESLRQWIETYNFKQILQRLNVHYLAHTQKLLVDIIKEDGTGDQCEAIPDLLLDAITRVCIGPGEHKSRLKLFTYQLFNWYSESETFILTDRFLNDLTGYLTNQIDTFIHNYNQELQLRPSGASKMDLENYSTFIYYILTETLSAISSKKNVHLKLFDVLDRILEFLPALPENIFEFLHSDKTPIIQWCIEQLMGADWLWKHTLPLASVFKDLNLEEELLELVVARFIRQMPIAPGEDLSLLTYQILLMTKKLSSKSKKREVFSAISEYFNQLNTDALQDKNVQAKLNEKESATLLHMGTAICQDNSLGTEYFSFVKSLKRREITSFTICLMLVMTKARPYKESILAHLKKEIEALVKLQIESKQFKWLEGGSPFIVPDTFAIFQNVIQKTSHNWEILEGLISLACSLLTTSASALPWWPPTRTNIPGFSYPSTLTSYQFKPPFISLKDRKKLNTFSTKDLGLFILSSLFEMHDMVRKSILEFIVAEISSRHSTVPAYIDLLRFLLESSFPASSSSLSSSSSSSSPFSFSTSNSSKSASFVLSHIRIFELLLDQLNHLPTAHACHLADLLVEVAQWHAGFRNTLMLFLRKAIVNKRPELREISIHAGLTLLQSTYQHNLGDMILYEIVGLLRRCFQFTSNELKLLFYIQLAQLLETHPGLGAYLLEPLSTVLEPYLFNSFKSFIDQCMDDGSIKEPLHWLLKCYVLATCTSTTNSFSDLVPNTDEFKTKLTKIANEFHQVEIFEFFPSGISFGLTPDCFPHFQRALLYFGCFNALFEFLFLTQTSSEFLVAFFEKRETFVNFIAKNFIDSKGRKGQSLSSLHSVFDAAPFFSLPMLVRVLPSQSLFLKTLLTQLASVVQQQQDYPWTLETAIDTSKLLLSVITREQMEFQTEQLRRDPKSIRFLSLALTSLKSIHARALLYPWSNTYLKALPSLESLFLLSKDFLLYPCAKEAIIIFQIMMQTPIVEQGPLLHQRVLDLVCSPSSSFEEELIVKPLFHLLFHLSKHMSGIFVLVARNILFRWGKLRDVLAVEHNSFEDDDMKLSPHEQLGILDSYKSQVHAASALCDEIEHCIAEIEWCLLEFKSEYGKRTKELPSEIQKLVPNFDAMLCRRFSVVLHAALLLSQSAVKLELTLPFMKMLTNTFATLNVYSQFKDKFTCVLGESLDVFKLGSQLHETVTLFQLAMDQPGMASRQGKKSQHQAKSMASLILQAEQFDVLVIQLSKRFKPLSKYIKRSAVRDFRFETHRITVDENEKDKGLKKKEHLNNEIESNRGASDGSHKRKKHK